MEDLLDENIFLVLYGRIRGTNTMEHHFMMIQMYLMENGKTGLQGFPIFHCTFIYRKVCVQPISNVEYRELQMQHCKTH